jgi:predicted phage terminase large subunit-like protein
MSSAAAVGEQIVEIRPQPGPQTQFLATEADIAVYGGAAGGGKTYGLLLDPLRNDDVDGFGGVIFRKTSVQVRVEGGLWDTSMQLYPWLGATPREGTLEWRFDTGFSMSFAHLEHEKDVYNYQGAQIPWIGFDELTHFSMNQFFYMLSRNRSVIGVPACIRATTNPDPDSWVKGFIRWWLDEKGQFPDLKKSGKLRWFIRQHDKFHWADTREELIEEFGKDDEIQPKSVTFIAAKLEDNKILLSKDKTYKANLLAMNHVDRMRLLYGDWNARANVGSLFKREWMPVIDTIPVGWTRSTRFWDRAGTKPSPSNRDPDWTRGVKLLRYPDGTYIVADLKSMRDTPGQVRSFIRNVASHDGRACKVKAQQDPGSAGKLEAEDFVRSLAGYNCRTVVFSKDKVTRAEPVSAACEGHTIKVLRAPWNDEFFNELENFSEDLAGHDDIVDAFSGAYNDLATGVNMCDLFSGGAKK